MGTALLLASQNGHSEVVQILLKGGADPNIGKEVYVLSCYFVANEGGKKKNKMRDIMQYW